MLGAMDLLKNQNRLQSEAQEILDKLELMQLLEKYGEAEVIGSVALGLMTWRDIDIEVVCKELKREDLAELVSELIKKPLRRIDFGVADNRPRFGTHSKIPKSLYIGMKYYGDDIPDGELLSSNPLVWKLDLHFLLKEDARGREKTRQLKQKLTEEKRRTILEIKDQIASNPKYRKQIFSMDIYEAVLDYGIKDLEGFKEYLRKSGREL